MKTDMEGNLVTYKAEFMANGYCQNQEIDYDETFSLVAMVKSIRILLVIAVFHNDENRQMDVKTIFLNGNLIKDVYMS